MNTMNKYVNLLNKNKILIILVWVIITIIIGSLFAPMFIQNTNNDFTAPPNSDAAKAKQLVQQYFHDTLNNYNYIIILQKQSGTINKQVLANFTANIVNQTKIIQGFDKIEGYSIFANTQLNSIKNEFMSNDSTVSLIVLSIKGDNNYQVTVAQKIRQIVQNNKPSGYNAYTTGLAELNNDTDKSIETDMSRIDAFVIPLILIALYILLRNWKYPLFTIFSIVLTIIISFGILDFLITNFGVTIQSFVPSVLISLILGIGVDYNLFLLTRFREERKNGKSVVESITTMLEHAGHTVFTSGITLTFALLGLAFFPITALSSVGIAIGIAVLILLAINLTLIPSVLLLFGEWIEPNKTKKNQALSKQLTNVSVKPKGFFYKVGRFATKNNFLVIALVLLITVPASLQMIDTNPKMQTSLLSPIGSESAQGFSILQNKFGPGSLGPIQMIVIQKNNDTWSNKTFSDTQLFIKKIIQLDNIHSNLIQAPSWLNGSAISSTTANAFINKQSPYYNSSTAQLYRQFVDPLVSTKGAFIVSISLSVDPNSPKAMNILSSMKNIASSVFDSNYEFGFYGQTANMASLITSTYNLFPIMILLVIIIIYIFIAIMFKALILPARLIATIALTLSFIYGMTTVVFEYNTFLNTLFPILNNVQVTFWMVPVMTFSIIIGLGIDYDIFTIERIKENVWQGYANDEAITMGIGNTARIITGAGLIMMIAFGGLMLSKSFILIQFGFVLAFGVLLDTFVVRTLLVPALMSFADKYNWWPNHPPKNPIHSIKSSKESNLLEKEKERTGTM